MNLLAAFIFLTRLPFWRIKGVPATSFKRLVPYWAAVGWLTGGVMAATFWLTAQVLPTSVACLLAILSRLLITGCLHEDGLADFLDGFGGGSNRERTLAIMKDSHIGSYGVIGLVIYFLLLWGVLSGMPVESACLLIVSGDCWSKCCAAQLINLLPYARREEESKANVVYERMSIKEWIGCLLFGIVPSIVFLADSIYLSLLFPLITLCFLYRMMKNRLQGYTGDCCGATFLLCELSFYIGAAIIYNQSY